MRQDAFTCTLGAGCPSHCKGTSSRKTIQYNIRDFMDSSVSRKMNVFMKKLANKNYVPIKIQEIKKLDWLTLYATFVLTVDLLPSLSASNVRIYYGSNTSGITKNLLRDCFFRATHN
jgi:hypothetical protein